MEPLSPADRLNDGTVGQAVSDVLARSPFTDRFDPHGLGELARSWQDGLTAAVPLADGVVLLLVVLTLVGVAALLGWSLRSFVSRRTPARLPGALLAEEPVAPPTGNRELDAARVALGRGEHRVAVELAWRAANLGLGGAGALTPRQWARWAASRLGPESRRDLMSLLRLHEACCYAGRLATHRAASLALELAARLGAA